MPRYFFHTADGRCIRDENGSDLAGLPEARTEAVTLLGELLKAYPQKLLDTGAYCVLVADEGRETLFTIEVDLREKAASGTN